MKCPKCGEEMQPGYLQAGNMMAFNRERHKLSLNSMNLDDVLIAQKVFLGSDFNGYICKTCGLVVFDYVNMLSHR